jgi:NAD(P)H-hydrate epimerase
MHSIFTVDDLRKLWKPREDSQGEDNGQVTIIGGSKLFHGAPILAIKAASRMTDMVFFSSVDPELEKISAKAQLSSFIWVPWEETEKYILKSDAILIGPGMMRYRKEIHNSQFTIHNSELDSAGLETKEITETLLKKFPEKRWVIDGGSLQVIKPDIIPKGAIITPNVKEFEMLFKIFSPAPLFDKERGIEGVRFIEEMARKYQCIILHKGLVGYVTDGETTYEIEGGNAGLTKGGTGDTLAGLTAGFFAKNPPLMAAAAASFVVKKTAEKLYEKVGYNFNSDDLAENVFEVMKELVS